MREAEERNFRTRREPVLLLDVERPQAAFAAWYELFPRSPANDPAARHIRSTSSAGCRRSRDMGFDVLYLPPIHPIGKTQPQGPQQRPAAAPIDLGSPYAIGSGEGGHDAIHPRAGHPRRFPPLGRRRRGARPRDRARFRDSMLARSSLAEGAPGLVRLAARRHRCDTPRTRRKNTRTSSTSISTRQDAVPDLWIALRDIVAVLDRAKACASFASIIRTPSRCRSGSG